MSRLVFRRVASRLLRSASQPPSDAELLTRFAASRDETAFAELVARHGGMVRGTARRCLGDGHAAEDVCQAAFLVLAGKAGAVRWGATVGPWLHATTVRLAQKARGRREISRIAADHVPTEVPSPAADPVTQVAWAEICGALDEELAALPEVLRGPLVLCYLQGHTRDEAAQALGCSLAKLKRRLERAREVLRERLTRRGITLPAAGLALLACDLPVGAATVSTTTRAAVAFATCGAVSPTTAGLLDVSRAGFRAKVLALLVAVTLVAGGALGLCGTVQLILDLPENQPHRADLAKMLVHRRARSRGLGAELMRAAEATARECGKTMLVLDTVTDGDAARLYERLGWVRVGDIPGYALMPEGGLCSTTVYYRTLGG